MSYLQPCGINIQVQKLKRDGSDHDLIKDLKKRKKRNTSLKENLTYRDFAVRHEDGKVGEVAARAGGVCFIGVQEFAALGGPVAHHAPLRVIPEGAIGVEVVLHLQITRDMVKCPNN